ncbi:NtaA/DmoA family FMN-dependent monooxygenase [Staphylococcus argensis]|uniref:LLM class flavin-dependent oxidoreductase n=1 Tax=Staphylococcus argensis TaxID=1607738 RepID=A0A2K4FE19_9STAP|nr:NtaA/DmoA family FMN-dependent monooxygenase [Staphylococcus argensis]MCY6991077.1 NtaA/DmoA family FMN-dependent monooxygenase [Staphylococcus argensis]POA09598.1 LLM class flavin-dependent oxidoreductase [Staphylococcus argensis]
MSEMHLTVLYYSTGLHPASWRLSDSHIDEVGDIDFQVKIAQLAEKGKLDAFFLGDGQYISGEETGHISYYFEPITALSVLSRETKYIGLISTISSTFYEPYLAARMLSSLQQLSHGRIGANIVTSQFDAEAQNFSMDHLPPLEQRYARADEFITVMKQLWDSFTTEAIINDREKGEGLDSQYIRPIQHEGKHFQVNGALNIPTSRFERPLLFQAGTSLPGRALAAKHVEAIFSIAWNQQDAQDFRADIHRRADTEHRRPPLVLPGMTVYVDETYERAAQLKAQLDDFIPLAKRKAQLRKAIGCDIDNWELDARVPELPAYSELTHKVARSLYEAIKRACEEEQLTLRQLLDRFGTWVGHKTIVGTPEQVAQEMIEWYENEACDGFMLMPPTYPESFEKFVDLVIPILQERGYFRTEYSEHTLKGHLKREKLD